MPAFDETKVRRSDDGKFAEKPAAPEAGGIDLAAGSPPSGRYNDIDAKDRSAAMLADLQRDVSAIVESGHVERYLDAMASNGLGKWSMSNRHLALSQLAAQRGVKGWDEFADMADSAHMMGFKQWQARDASVRKGEKAIYILAPSTRRRIETKADGTEEEKRWTTFRSAAVFDVSQCEGPGTEIEGHGLSAAEGEVPPGTLDGLRDRVRAAGYGYSEREIAGSDPATLKGKLGYTTADGSKQVVVDSRLGDLQKAAVIAHELGHIECGHIENYSEYAEHRGRMEAEAETAAYMTMRSRGVGAEPLRSFSPGYIATWAKGEPAKITAAMSAGMKAHSKIMEGDWPEVDTPYGAGSQSSG